MDRKTIQRYLDRTEKHLATSDKLVADRKALIALLEERGRDTARSKTTLAPSKKCGGCTWRTGIACCRHLGSLGNRPRAIASSRTAGAFREPTGSRRCEVRSGDARSSSGGIVSHAIHDRH